MKNKKKLIPLVITMLIISSLFGCNGTSKSIQDVSSDISKTDNINDTENISENKTFENKGLLLGLSCSEEESYDNPTKRTADKLKSIWVYLKGDKLSHKEKKGAIVTAAGNKFYELRNDVFEMSEESGVADSYDFYSKYNFNYSYSSISSNIIGHERVPIYTEDSFIEKNKSEHFEWPFQTRAEWPWYVGDKYALIMSDYYETGGGTFRSGSNNIQLYSIKGLGKIYEREQTKSVFDLLEKSIQNELIEIAEKYNKDAENNATEMEKKVMDIKNLALTRKEGKWIIKIPIFSQYHHEGNGSSFYNVQEYIDYNCILPESLVHQEELAVPWKEIIRTVPEAVDAVSSPEKELLVVLTNMELLIYKEPKNGLKDPDLKIPLDGGERIVLNQWASADESEEWNSKLLDYFKKKDDTLQSNQLKQGNIEYKNEKLGFSLSMPKSWSGKYRIQEQQEGIRVFFKPVNAAGDYDGALFYIIDKSNVDEDFLDTVGEPRSFTAKGIEYIVGGPTDLRFDPEHPEFTDFTKMVEEVSKVVGTIKAE